MGGLESTSPPASAGGGGAPPPPTLLVQSLGPTCAGFTHHTRRPVSRSMFMRDMKISAADGRLVNDPIRLCSLTRTG